MPYFLFSLFFPSDSKNKDTLLLTDSCWLQVDVQVRNALLKAVVSDTVKRSVIETIVPTVISLKHLLEKERSQLLEDLFIYLRKVNIY